MSMENFLKSIKYWYLIEMGFMDPAEGVVLTKAQQEYRDDQAILETILKKNM